MYLINLLVKLRFFENVEWIIKFCLRSSIRLKFINSFIKNFFNNIIFIK